MTEYLKKRGLSQKLSQKYVDYVGARSIYLANGATNFCKCKAMNPLIDDDSVYSIMIMDLFAWKLIKQREALFVNEPYSTEAVAALTSRGEFVRTDLMDKIKQGTNKTLALEIVTENQQLATTIQNLVAANVLPWYSGMAQKATTTYTKGWMLFSLSLLARIRVITNIELIIYIYYHQKLSLLPHSLEHSVRVSCLNSADLSCNDKGQPE